MAAAGAMQSINAALNGDCMQVAESDLERALRLAAGDPVHGPGFFQALLQADVYVLGEAEPVASGALDAGAHMSIQHWTRGDGSIVIPFFSSVLALQRAVSADRNYLQLSARALFEITRGAALVLNPRSRYCKELQPDEVETLLRAAAAPPSPLPADGAGLATDADAEPTQVFVGPPAIYPDLMIDALTTLLAQRATVRAAYLSLILAPAVDSRPHLLVGIEADGEAEQVLRDAAAVATATAPPGKVVDLTLVAAGEDELSDYLLHSVPAFYERRWGARLGQTPGIGHA